MTGALPAIGGVVLLAACIGLLAIRPDPGVPSGVAIAEPGAPQTLLADDIGMREFDLVNWAVSGIALAVAEDAPVNRISRLSLVATPRAARRIYDDFGAVLREHGFAETGVDVHDIDVTGFTLTRDRGRLVVDAEWRPLALSEDDTHNHLPGRDFAARVTLERGPAQWRVAEFELTSDEQ